MLTFYKKSLEFIFYISIYGSIQYIEVRDNIPTRAYIDVSIVAGISLTIVLVIMLSSI